LHHGLLVGVNVHSSHLPGLLERIAGRRVLVVGDLILDEYIDGEAARISPEAPVPVLRFSSQRSVLGGAGNTAANVASLGGQATLVGAMAGDSAGDEVRRQCSAAGIHLAAIDDERPTIRKVRVISRQQQLLRIDYEDGADLAGRAQSQLVATVRDRVDHADVVVVSDYAKGLLTAGTFAEIRRVATQAGKAVVVDPRPSHASFYEGSDYLTPNWKEALGLLREDDGAAPSVEAADRVGNLLRARFQANVLLTLGSRGMSFFPRDGSATIDVSALAREVFDVSGAGDTVVAAFALGIAGGLAPADAVWLANRAAAVVVGKRGTATVTPAELLALGDA
jgi:D-beta-D-heptose 7-phosphate kinase/D-beta-D-heptose 1-phosphate adenosyltransferase